MGASGARGSVILPRSESAPRELYKIRYMDQVTTSEQRLTPYGSHGLAIAVVLLAVFVIVGAIAFSSLVLGSARIVVSDVTMTPGTCETVPSIGYASSTLLYAFVLTNPTGRNATAALDFYANGQLVDTSWYNPVPAGQALTLHHSAAVDLCGPTTATVLVRSATYL